MASEKKYFRLGLFVLGAIAILVAAIIVLGAGSLFERTFRAETYIEESIQGLDVGAPVKYRGVKVGELEKVDFVTTRYGLEDGRIRLVMAFRMDVVPRLERETPDEAVRHMTERGLRIRLASAGLTGGVYLELDLKDPKANPPPAIGWTPEHPYLPSVPSTGAKFTSSVEVILEHLEKIKFQEISDKILVLLDSLNGVIKNADPAVTELRTVLSDADGLVKDVRRLVNEDVGKEVKSLLSTTRDVIEKEVGPAVKSTRVAAEHLPATLEKIDGTLDRVASTLRRIDRTLSEDTGSIDESLDNLRVATGDLRELLGEVKRYPTQALFGEAPPKKAVTK
jgi:phospholipid/cholesterol/gamma-HCH transport system substrate-binding protein/paraquat-inducible protein B